MPVYKTEPSVLLYEEDVRKMFDLANDQEALAIALLWQTGARPGELQLLKKENFLITEDKLEITIKTLKLRKSATKYQISERTLRFDRPKGLKSDVYIETITNYVKNLYPEAKVMMFGKRWLEYKIAKLSQKALDKPLSPYHFRHSVMSWLAKNGATAVEIKDFKGAKSLLSVDPYMHAVPYRIRKLNRSKHNSDQGIGSLEQITVLTDEEMPKDSIDAIMGGKDG